MEDTSELCSYCGKQFSDSFMLYRHSLICLMNDENAKSLQRICPHCGKIFSHKSSLHRHEKICKEGTPENKLKCSVCYSEFNRIDNYRRHRRVCNLEVPKAITNATCKLCHKLFSKADFESHTCITKKRHLLSTCLYEDCKMTFYRRSQLIRHLRNAHGNRIEEEKTMTFGSVKEFFDWKFSEEQATTSCFTKRSGTRANTDYYYCQLDGSSKPHCKTGHPARKTNRKVKKGLVKRDKICLAKIKVKIQSDHSCKVVYQPTHSHKLHTKDCRPRTSLLDLVTYVNEQMSMGVSPKKYFKSIIYGKFDPKGDIRQQKTGQPILVSGVQTRDLYKQIKIKNDKDEAVSVMIRVALLSKERPNCVILYKPLGEDKVIGPGVVDPLINSLDLFILGIQTKEQKSMMLQHGTVVLSIAWTNDTNMYEYNLLTFVVPDEYNRAYPVAYFISSHFNEATLCSCLLAIKNNCPDLNVSSVVVPDHLPIIEALQKSFDKDVTCILCLFSIQKVFHQYLHDMAPKKLVDDMHQALCSIIQCDDELEVTNRLQGFIENYSERAPTFVLFLKRHYLHRIEQWSMAYRKFFHANMNTTILNESVHNQINAADPNDLNARRLDDLINTLLDMEEDASKKKCVEEYTGIPYGLGDVPIQHAGSLKITDQSVIRLNNNLWEISCLTNSEKVYIVVKCADDCLSNSCYFTCNDCDKLCSHLYSCTCEDKNPLCSHVHKVHRLALENKPLLELSRDELVVSELAEEDELNTTEQLGKIKKHLRKLSLFIKNEEIAPAVLNRVENSLRQLLSELEVQQHSTSQTVVDDELRCSSSQIEILQDSYEIKYEESDLLVDASMDLKDSVKLSELTSVFDLPITDIAPESFTPSLDYASLNQVVIKIGLEELLLLYLKTLDPYLTGKELERIKQCNKYQEGYMYPSLINSFLLHLQRVYTQISSVHSEVALSLQKNCDVKTFFTKVMPEKDVLIMPMNLSDNYWTCIAIFTQLKEIIYFNPLGKMTKNDEKSVMNFLNVVECNEWSITIQDYAADIEDDGIAYGVHICHFAEEIAKQNDLVPLKDVDAFRKHMYESIVGGCLKRDKYDDSFCGKCKKYDCPVEVDEIADFSICCRKCNQWYHTLCIGNFNSDFTCPA